jgi:hypothetical protein
MSETRRTMFVGRTAEGDRIYAEMSIRQDDEGARLSASGFRIGKGRRTADSAGQMLDDLLEVTRPASGWTLDDIRSLHTLWTRWHLNDMRPGCEHQRAEKWGERPIDPSKPTSTYGIHYEGQQHASWNLLGWVRPSEHPGGLLGKPCPVCGYGYGTAWKREEPTADVLAEWARLMTLPTGDVPSTY